MNKFIFLIAAVVFSLFAISCDLGGSTGNPSERTFWARDQITGDFYSLRAQRLASNARCEVWVERGSGITSAEAEEMASTYAYNIYDKMMRTFGWTAYFSGHGYLNTMQYADALVDGNGKLIILLLDIRDGYTGGENEGYVAGYFWSGNFFENRRLQAQDPSLSSNECSMVYIDVNPGFKNKDNVYRTLAHEMQHLMNFVTSNLYIGNNRRSSSMDTWIDEGLSAAAEWVYAGTHSTNRIDWYNRDRLGTIAKGNNFFVWDNHNAVLDDYATVYLFFQWLRLQKSTNIYNSIMLSNSYDHSAVVNAFGGGVTWSYLLRNWLAANYLGSTTGETGYRNDPELNKLTKHHLYIDNDTTSVYLYPGEGVYSYVSSGGYSVPSPSFPISYSGLSSSGTVSSIPAGGALLTYNVSTDNKADTSSGTITGNPAPPKSPNIQPSVSASRSASSSSGLFPIGAGDVLRRRGNHASLEAMPLQSGASRSTGEGSQNPFVIEGEIMRYRDFPNE